MSVKNIFGLILSVILSVTLVAAIGGFFINSPPNPDGQPKAFQVKEGQTLEQIADKLHQDGLIRSPLFLRAIAKLRGVETQIQKGNYLIPQSQTSIGILDLLVNGQQSLIRVTIPDGFTLKKVAAEMANHAICSAADFLQAANDKALMKELGVPFDNAEGFIFPDTYFFSTGYPAKKVVEHLVGQFFRELATVYPAYKDLSPTTLGQRIVMASIVEREYVAPDEAPLMASVFNNRLRIGKALESCATVEYVMTEKEGLPHPERLYFRDLDRPSPYNTYRHTGLPPGPISNPGTVAVRAAFFPAQTDYLFFVLKNPTEKRHQFSRTFSDHEQAIQLYIKQ